MEKEWNEGCGATGVMDMKTEMRMDELLYDFRESGMEYVLVDCP